jgi:hypothetical protein
VRAFSSGGSHRIAVVSDGWKKDSNGSIAPGHALRKLPLVARRRLGGDIDLE